MDASGERMGARNNRHIPMEIVEKILCNLPIKSLVRFSCVSNSWDSMISESELIRKHLSGRKRMIIIPPGSDYLNTASSCPFSSISSNHPIIEDSTDLICPFGGNPSSAVHLHAFCDELLCVQVENSLFLWNPSIRTYRKLPDPTLPPWSVMYMSRFICGLGYDSVGDDYKILKIPWLRIAIDHSPETELYSLRSDSWRKINRFPGNLIRRRNGEFVSGALHWMARRYYPAESQVIVSFDLSTEMYGVVAQPEYPLTPSLRDSVEVIVLREMLCVCLNYFRDNVFVLWVMKDYGIEKSWVKMLDIQDYNSIPFFTPRLMRIAPRIAIRPLYFYNNGEILIKVSTDRSFHLEIFIYKDEKTIPKKIVGRGKCSNISEGFLYVESFVSPAMWPTNVAPVVGNNEA